MADRDPWQLWEQIARAAYHGAPLSDEARRYLVDVADRIERLISHPERKPEEAARQVPAALEIDAKSIREWRASKRAVSAGILKDMKQQQGATKAEAAASAIAAMLGRKSGRSTYRWLKKKPRS
jgi:hypothetical protein